MATHPVFLPGTSHGCRSLAGYSPWGCKESDMTQVSFYNLYIDKTFSEYIKLPVPLEAGRLETIICIAVGVRVNLSGELKSHLRGLDLNTPNCPGTLLIGAVS